MIEWGEKREKIERERKWLNEEKKEKKLRDRENKEVKKKKKKCEWKRCIKKKA